MLAKFPTDGARLTKTDLDRQVLRLGIIAELDAIDLYEQLAAATSDKRLKSVFLDVAKEEKTHVGEFLGLLLEKDKEQVREFEAGKKEIRKKSG
ncbi:MAG: rubrerythrin [Euryarchaeota archaeon RBG_13_57_23]|nr:MAG: rubrerythrin [Euryarchaeota archaeon RBG_13_57_23]